MSAPTFAFIAGIVYMGLGVLGMLASLVIGPPSDAPAPAITMNFGYLFGVFAVNAVLNLAHFVLGFWGLIAWTGALSAVNYARSLSFVGAALALMGLIPGLKTAFGAAPLYGHDVWLHALTALLAGYIGFRSTARLAVAMTAAPAGKASVERRHTSMTRRRVTRPVAEERRKGEFDRRDYGGTLSAG
jgi:hypothetical protein